MSPVKAAALAAVAGTALMLSACGSDGDNASTPPQPMKSAPAKPSTGGMNSPKAPASAGDKRPAAPDDAISRRPGGPANKSKKKTGGRQTGGVSPGY